MLPVVQFDFPTLLRDSGSPVQRSQGVAAGNESVDTGKFGVVQIGFKNKQSKQVGLTVLKPRLITSSFLRNTFPR